VCVYICIYVCMYVYVCVCMYICVCVYIYIYCWYVLYNFCQTEWITIWSHLISSNLIYIQAAISIIFTQRDSHPLCHTESLHRYSMYRYHCRTHIAESFTQLRNSTLWPTYCMVYSFSTILTNRDGRKKAHAPNHHNETYYVVRWWEQVFQPLCRK